MKNIQAAVTQLRESSRQAVRELGFLETRYRETGCTHSQCHILVELDTRKRLSVGELARILSQDISSTSRSIRPLIDEGVIKVHSDAADGRRRQLQLTPEGMKKVSEINDVAEFQARAALELLSPSDQNIVTKGMGLYAQALSRCNKLAEIEIRPISPNDDDEMSAVIRQVMSEFGAVGAGMSIGDSEVDSMHEAYQSEKSAFFIACKGKKLLGGAGIAPLAGCQDHETCELRKMYILPTGRGIGLGHQIMTRCLEFARGVGYRQIYLETLANMVHAQHLFEKFGFRYLDEPLGDTGHDGCTTWAILDL